MPTPPRSRYAAVATSALIGAGMVAAATSAAMPDMKANPGGSGLSSISGAFAANRQAAGDRANRSTDRVASLAAGDKSVADIWRLPMANYSVGAPFGERSGPLQRGVELNAPMGTPFYSAHSGTVTFARWSGGYGYMVIVNVGNGVEIVYGHASALKVHEGDHVNAGDLLALTGSTGYSFAPHVHFEIRVNGVAVDPSAYMLAHGVNVEHHTDGYSLAS